MLKSRDRFGSVSAVGPWVRVVVGVVTPTLTRRMTFGHPGPRRPFPAIRKLILVRLSWYHTSWCAPSRWAEACFFLIGVLTFCSHHLLIKHGMEPSCLGCLPAPHARDRRLGKFPGCPHRRVTVQTKKATRLRLYYTDLVAGILHVGLSGPDMARPCGNKMFLVVGSFTTARTPKC